MSRILGYEEIETAIAEYPRLPMNIKRSFLSLRLDVLANPEVVNHGQQCRFRELATFFDEGFWSLEIPV